MLEKEALISIIVPVYNVEKYLKRCIDSILCQTYQNFEIIIVDDGSTDTSPEICDQYSALDDRITVIHKINGGLSDARNAGIEVAKGDYITFVDSDDMIVRQALYILLSHCIQYECDIAVSTRYRVFDTVVDCDSTSVNGSIVADNVEAEKIIFCQNTRWEAWGTLYE